MAKGKRCTSIAELASDGSAESQQFANELTEQIGQRTLVRLLADMRNRHSVTQEQLAKFLDCQQAKISKLENGFDQDVTVRELTAYAKLAKCDLGIVFKSRNLSIVDEVKAYVRGLRRCLSRLNTLAAKDSEIAKGVAKYHLDALVELITMFAESAKELREVRKISSEPKVLIEVEEPNQVDDHCETKPTRRRKPRDTNSPLSV